MLKARVHCMLVAHATRLPSDFLGSRFIGSTLVQRKGMSWSANRKDPSVSETNGYILRRRQRGESLEKTFGYVSSIMKSGFKPDAGTLLSLMATDVCSPAQILDLAGKLRLELSKAESGDAWDVMFKNIVLEIRGWEQSSALDFAIQQYEVLVAARYPLPQNPILALLRQASLSDIREANSIITWRWEKAQTDSSPWISSAAETLISAHLNVQFSNRATLFRKGIIDLDRERLYVDPIVNECIKATWHSENHSDAAHALFKLCGPDSTADSFMAAWNVLWHTRYRQSYVPTPNVLREGYDFALRRYGLSESVLTTAAFGHAASARKLRARASDRELLGKEQTLAVFDGARALANLVDTILSSAADSINTRGALIHLVAQTGDHTALLQAWSSYCQIRPPKGRPRDDDLVLRIALSGCRPGHHGPSTASEILRIGYQNLEGFRPTPSHWAAFICCLAAGNALQPALACARDRLQGQHDLWKTLLPILDCAYRLGELPQTRTFLETHLRELYLHPRVMLHAARLRKGSKAAVQLAQTLPTTGSALWLDSIDE